MFSKAFIVAAIASLVAAAPTHTDAAPAKRSADSYNNQATYYDVSSNTRMISILVC